MTTLLTALNASAVITTSSAPALGYINRYNASGGVLTVTLPALSTANVGAQTLVEIDTLDTSFNSVRFTAAGTDTFVDGTVSFNMVRAGEKCNLQVVSVSGVKYWKIIGAFIPRGDGIATAVSQFALTNSTAATQVIGTGVPVPLNVSATYRIQLCGTVQTSAVASSTLTFTPLVVNTALAQTCQMPSQGSALGPVGFDLRYIITIRTSGSSGTAIAKPFGVINFSTPLYLMSTSASTTTVNTTSTSVPIIGLNAQWGAANASNSLLVDIATIERIT
jgi:hypothetical protein